MNHTIKGIIIVVAITSMLVVGANTLPAAAEVASSTTSTPTSSLDCNGAFENIPLIFRQTTLEKIQDCVTITGKVTFTHYYSPDGDAIVNVYPDPQFLHLMGLANTRAPFVGQYPGPGGIHAEIPCQVAPKLTKPFQGDYCRGDNKALWPHIPVRPKVGDHVKVTGTLATDRSELGGITEIHPVTDIQIIGTTGGSGPQSNYQIGYNDGCAGNVVPGPHTSDYKRGYADGQVACSRGSSGGAPIAKPNTFHVKVEQVIFIARDIMLEQYKLTTTITIMDL